MKFFRKKIIENFPYKLDYYEWHNGYVYKLNFNSDYDDWLLFNTEEDLKNYVIYHEIKNYTTEIVEIISNNLKYGGKI